MMLRLSAPWLRVDDVETVQGGELDRSLQRGTGAGGVRGTCLDWSLLYDC